MKISMDAIKEAVKTGYPVTVEINGEYYELDVSGLAPEFIAGVMFAAAYIEDGRARLNASFEWIEGRKANTPKRAYRENQARNDEIKFAVDCLKHLIEDKNALNNAIARNSAGKFWRLET